MISKSLAANKVKSSVYNNRFTQAEANVVLQINIIKISAWITYIKLGITSIAI
jgi:hypothetical protein